MRNEETNGQSQYKMFLLLSHILNIKINFNKNYQSEQLRLPYICNQLELNYKLILNNFTKENILKQLDSLDSVNIFGEDNYLNIEDIFISRRSEQCKSDQMKIFL